MFLVKYLNVRSNGNVIDTTRGGENLSFRTFCYCYNVGAVSCSNSDRRKYSCIIADMQARKIPKEEPF